MMDAEKKIFAIASKRLIVISMRVRGSGSRARRNLIQASGYVLPCPIGIQQVFCQRIATEKLTLDQQRGQTHANLSSMDSLARDLVRSKIGKKNFQYFH